MASPDYDLSMTAKTVEPKKRMVGGRYGYAVHRFPIKGGISFLEAMTESVSPTQTPFLQALRKRVVR